MSDLSYKNKYLKYKFKYINLKGGRLLDSKDTDLIKQCSIEDERNVYSSDLLNRKKKALEAKKNDLIITNDIKNINDSIEESFTKNTKCNAINLQYTDNNKFYFYLELESKANIIQGDLFTNLIMYTHINPNNIFIIYSNISKQKDYFSKRLDKDNLYEFDKNNDTNVIYDNIKKFITDTIKNKIINRYKRNRNTSIIFDIFTHGNIFSENFIAIDGNNKYINFKEFYELFDTAYEKDIDVENKSISNITFIASWCYSSILKNFLKRFLNQPIAAIMQLNKTKYINFHFLSSLPINNNFLIIGSYLFSNENILNISNFTDIKSNICKFVVDTFGYTVVEAENMVNKFISFQNTTNFLQFTKLYNNARKQKNTNLQKEPGNCSNFFFDLYMGGNTNVRFFLQQIIDASITNDTFILLKNMDLKLNKINETYINWIKNIKYRNEPYDIIYLRNNAIINNIDSYTTPNLSSLLFNSNVTFDNTCWNDIISPGDDKLIKYLNDLFKDSFDSMEFYSNLNYNKLTDKNSLLSDIF